LEDFHLSSLFATKATLKKTNTNETAWSNRKKTHAQKKTIVKESNVKEKKNECVQRECETRWSLVSTTQLCT